MRKIDESAEEQVVIKRRKKIIMVVVATSVIMISIYGWWQKTVPVEMTSPSISVEMTETTRKSAREPVVYVSGQVKHPGVLKVSAGARVIDAINAAGGLAEGADVFKINLAQIVKDGMQIHVPGSLSVPAAGAKAIKEGNSQSKNNRQEKNAPSVGAEKININTASDVELDKLPGIGPSLAARIVEWRKTYGNFHDGADIIKVPGVGEAKYQLFKDHITW